MDVHIERRVDGVHKCHAEVLENVCDVLCLPQHECAMCAVAVNFESDDLADVAEFGQLKMSFEFVCESVGVSRRGREHCHVFHMDSNEREVVGGSVAVHALVREEACEAEGHKCGVELEVPLASRLLEPLERVVQAAGGRLPISYMGGCCMYISSCSSPLRYTLTTSMTWMSRSRGKEGAQCLEPYNGCECFDIIDASFCASLVRLAVPCT